MAGCDRLRFEDTGQSWTGRINIRKRLYVSCDWITLHQHRPSFNDVSQISDVRPPQSQRIGTTKSHELAVLGYPQNHVTGIIRVLNINSKSIAAADRARIAGLSVNVGT